MATIEHHVCDRCREGINKHHRRINITRPKPKILRYFINFGVGVRIDRTVELCGKCTKEFEVFLYGPKEEVTAE